MFLFDLILIITIIVFIVENNNLRSKLTDSYKNNKFNKRIKYCPHCGKELFPSKSNTVSNNIDTSSEIVHNTSNNINTNTNTYKVNNSYSYKDIKNTLILSTGSILLVLSALLLLTTTWDVTTNFLKSFILLVMLLIFISTSYIADTYLNLKKTSKAFKYISLLYLPIILVSFSLFNLFGNFFSITGPGKYIYLAISFSIITIIYYYNMIKDNTITMAILTILSSIISIIFITSIFSTNFNTILFSIISFILILNILYKNKLYIYNNIFHKNTIITLFIIILYYILHQQLIYLFINTFNIFNTISFILILINYYYINKYISNNKLFDNTYPLFIIFIFISIIPITNIYLYKQIILLLVPILLYIVSFLYKKNITKEVYYYVVSYLILFSMINSIYISLGNNINIINNYIIIGILSILSFIYYYNNHNKVSSYISSLSLIISLYSYFNYNIITIDYLSIIGLFMIILSITIIKEINLKESFEVVGIITLIALSILFKNINLIILITYILFIILLFIMYINKKDGIYKVLSYIYFNILFIFFFRYINSCSIDVIINIITVVPILLIIFDYLIDYLSDNTNKYYILSQSIFALLIQALNTYYIGFSYRTIILVNILLFTIIYYINYKKINNNIKCIFYILLIPHIYDYINRYSNNINLNLLLLLSCSFLVLYLVLLFCKREKKYMFLYFTFLLFHIDYFDINKYLSLLLFVLGFIISYYISNNNKLKDLFKVSLYTCILVFIEFIIYDLGLDNISVFRFIPYIIYLLVITRSIFIKYKLEYEVWEYIGLILINCISLINYTSQLDGMWYVFILVIIVAITYYLKYNPVFIVCLVFIVINVLLLTMEFWLSLPWWLYISFIGFILIVIAFNNEMHDK